MSKAINICWNIWNQRSNIKINLGSPDFSKTIREVMSKDRDEVYLRACGKIVPTVIRSETLLSQRLWSPPPCCSWKINTDASWLEKERRGGVGWIARDSLGSLIFAGFKPLKRKWSIKCLEMLAVAESLKCLLENVNRPFPKIIVESDFADVVAILNRISADCSEVALFAEEVQRLVKLSGAVSFSSIPRGSNLVAHYIARSATACDSPSKSSCFLGSSISEDEQISLGPLPSWLSSSLIKEFSVGVGC